MAICKRRRSAARRKAKKTHKLKIMLARIREQEEKEEKKELCR